MNKHVSSVALDPATRNTSSRTHIGRFTELDTDKLRGGYYTSVELASWLCAWAIRRPDELVLEPSCGDGTFLEAASAPLEALGAHALSLRDIAPDLSLPLGTVKTRLMRARHRLRRIITDRIQGGFETILLFAGSRCTAMAEGVGALLKARHSLSPDPDAQAGLD